MLREKDKVSHEDEASKSPSVVTKTGEAGQLDDSDISNLYEESKVRTVTDTSEVMLLKENMQSEKVSLEQAELKQTAEADK